MDNKLAISITAAPDKVLVEVVKLAQKQGRQGSKGGWKEFLKVYDPKFGSSLSDPARRPREALLSFLNTFTEPEHLKFIANFLRSHSNCEMMKQIVKESPDNESPEQRLVRLTLEHPLYLSKYAFPSYKKDWVVTKFRKKSKLMSSNKMLAVDCEMVLCEDGTDALVRVCVVDHNLQVQLDELVNPHKPVADYRTEITGITASDLDRVPCSLGDIQKSMKKLLSRGTILAGHSLYNDLLALKLDHARVVDTSFIFKTLDGCPPSLNNLCKSVLGYEVRKEGASHNCLDDACAAMKLVLAKIGCGVDNDIPLIQEDVQHVAETEMAKLLLHRVPLSVPSKELLKLFPGKFTIELKQHKIAKGVQYSMHAIFKNPQEAHEAFENLDGSLEKDTFGWPQKRITFQLNTGGTATIFVRKMAHDRSLQVSSKKRPCHVEDLGDPKKLKTDQCDDHLKEIARLKQELREKDLNQCENLKEIERLKQELRERDLNQCENHLTEIKRLKKDLRLKEFEISTQDKIITELKQKLEEKKTNRKKGP